MKTTNPKDFIELLEVYAIALTNSVMDKSDIIKWADEIISKDKEPHELIIELSLCGHKSNNDIISVINEFVGLDKSILSGRVTLALLYHGLLNGQIKLGKVTSSINWLVWHGGLSQTEKDFLYGLDDDYYLANEKIAGTLEAIEKWTLNFLIIYKEFTLTNFKDWEEINKQVSLNIQEFVDKQKNKADT